MRKQLRRVCCGILVLVLVVVTVSCSSIFGGSKPPEEPGKKPPETQPKTQPETQPKTQPKKPTVEAIIQQGITYREAGNLKKAISSFNQALEIEPKNAKADQYLQETQQELNALVEEHLKQGIKYFTQDALQEAMDEWNTVLELDPSNQKALDYKERTQRKLDALNP